MDLPLALPLIMLIAVWTGTALLVALAYPAAARLIRGIAPAFTSAFQLVYALLPVLVAGAISLLVFSPFLGGLNLTGHCHGLDCGSHVPVLSTTDTSGRLIITALSALVLTVFAVLAVSIWRNLRVVQALCRLSRADAGEQYGVLETPEVLACCAGLLRPRVLISRGLLDRAGAAQLRVIVCHELAHRYRLDNLRRLIAAVATWAWPRQRRRLLLEDMELASELSCDEDVARLIGDRGLVAETIDAVCTWRRLPGTGDDPESATAAARIASLTAPVLRDPQGWKPAAMILTSCAFFTLLAGDMLHRGVEAVLTVVPY